MTMFGLNLSTSMPPRDEISSGDHREELNSGASATEGILDVNSLQLIGHDDS